LGRIHPQIDEALAKKIQSQPVFFVATAPLRADGNLNLSPKGLDSFRILDPRTVAYLDVIGSGVETIAHLKENGRIIIMFCMFDGPPNIVRRMAVAEPSSLNHQSLPSWPRAFLPMKPPAPSSWST